ncbi:MAG: aminotransferase class I/II-fold pyridoxal phosphate-dependent enzyme [Thermoplasmatota archaeon]
MKRETLCVMESTDEPSRPVNTPAYYSSTYHLDDETYRSIAEGEGRRSYVYSRWRNPTVAALEHKMAKLEDGESAIATASGMAAISATMLSFLGEGDELVTSRDLYGGTFSFIEKELRTLGIGIRYVDCTSPDEVAMAISDDTALLFFESLTNPLLNVIDIPAMAAVAHDHELPLAIDATFASPVNQQPLHRGADIVVHSTSKYIGGHSDLIGGMVVASEETCDDIWGTMTRYGGCLDPHAAFLLLRSLKTLHLRMREHNSNAMKLARFLEGHEKVERVWYPGLPSHPQHGLAQKMLGDYGGMITFRITGGDRDGIRFMRSLQVASEAASLGGVETLVSMPYNTSHSYLTDEERAAIGILPGTIRLSVGVEHVDDLKADLSQALDDI